MRYRINTFIDDSKSIAEFDNLSEALEEWTEIVSYSNCYTSAQFIEVEVLRSGKTKSEIILEKELD